MPLTAAVRRAPVVLGLMAGLLVAGTGAAHALDEAQIVEASCTGLRVTQVGLPPGRTLEVKAMDADRARVLVEHETRSSADGRLDIAMRADLRGVRHVLVEVAGGEPEVEYGEVPRTVACAVAPAVGVPGSVGGGPAAPDAGPGRHAPASPSAAPGAVPVAALPADASSAPSSGAGSGWTVAAVTALAALAAAGTGLLVRRRSPR